MVFSALVVLLVIFFVSKENWERGREGRGEEKTLMEFRALVPTMSSGLISLLFLYL